jgi:hypothetical protein
MPAPEPSRDHSPTAATCAAPPQITSIVSTPSDRSTPRREFLGQITASAIVLAGSACASPAVATEPAPTPSRARSRAAPAPVHWDDSWFGRLTAKHRAVFDSPQIEDGLAVFHAASYISGMRESTGAGGADVQAVVVLRHAAIPMALNDAMWAKYQMGKEAKVKDYSTKKWATRNPFLDSPPQSPPSGSPAEPAKNTLDRPRSSLTWLATHGHVLLGCDLAMRGHAFTIADEIKGDGQAVYEEFTANLIPGVILQPSGVYAAHRAQEAGCTYIRST